jgi:hypothetical protein
MSWKLILEISGVVCFTLAALRVSSPSIEFIGAGLALIAVAVLFL